MTNSNKAAATDNKAADTSLTDKINDAANGTTASGDAKGEAQVIGTADVGSLNDVLGNLANAAAAGNTTATLIENSDASKNDFDRVYKEGDAGAITNSENAKPLDTAAGSITDIAAAAATVAKEAAAPATGGVTTQRADVINAAPANVELGIKDGTNNTVVAQATAEKKVISAGTVVKSTAAVPVSQLPEVAAAFEVAKPQTISALNNLLEYCRLMHPAQPQTTASIEKNQVMLLASLKGILIAEDVNFNTVFKAVMAIVKANRKEAFAITMRNRGLNSVTLATIDNVDMRFLTRLIDALHAASGVNDISTVKTIVDMNKLLGSINNVRAKNNLTAFFS